MVSRKLAMWASLLTVVMPTSSAVASTIQERMVKFNDLGQEYEKMVPVYSLRDSNLWGLYAPTLESFCDAGKGGKRAFDDVIRCLNDDLICRIAKIISDIALSSKEYEATNGQVNNENELTVPVFQYLPKSPLSVENQKEPTCAVRLTREQFEWFKKYGCKLKETIERVHNLNIDPTCALFWPTLDEIIGKIDQDQQRFVDSVPLKIQESMPKNRGGWKVSVNLAGNPQGDSFYRYIYDQKGIYGLVLNNTTSTLGCNVDVVIEKVRQ